MRTSVLVSLLASVAIFLGAVSLSWDRLSGGPFFWTSEHASTPQVCDVPIRYKIGDVNPAFGVGRYELERLVRDAANLWEDLTDEVLFVYDPNGGLEINLIYDDRQVTWDEQATARREVDEATEHYRQLDREYQRHAREFEEHRRAYEVAAGELEEEIRIVNERIDQWNQSDGEQTEEEAARLEEEVQALQEKRQRVEEMQRELEAEQAALSDLVDRVNEAGRATERLIASYNRQYASMEGFNKAIYHREGELRFVHVYQFDGQDDLMRVLAHELGHALGIEHVDDPSAIMYSEVTEQNRSLVELSLADFAALQNVCRK